MNLLVVTREDGTTTRLQVLEHEFYFQKSEIHEDPFTHGAEEQKILGRWYFHRAPRRSADSNRSATSLTSYRDGSRKGMDLTFGCPASKSNSQDLLRGGVLLRSIRVLGDKSKVISGPSLLVDQVLSLSGTTGIRELVENKWEGNTSAFPSTDASESPPISLRVVSKASLGLTAASLPTIYKSPRIGLDLSHPGTTSPKVKPLHSRIQFLPRNYRYFIKPDELVANGRIQTFVGLVNHFAAAYEDMDAALRNQKLVGEICRTMGLKDATAKKYLAYFKEGREGGIDSLEEFIGPKGKGASSSPASYLTMMGAMSDLS
ncbi:hypothetical protein BKA70DRAFT_1576095 [Coprinopsis sp. MPI-PUGE-AT-0042]|nr:hypothetical protein BKA70DRAFT_1576095 [Coprinopsis sp. MPI-PUGE-AT-0042]